MNTASNLRNYSEELSGNLASRIAFALEQEIVDSGWPIGKQLGLEEDLAKRFGIGRWVMREALAITQRDGLTQMRRGRNGGVYISAPPVDVVATTMRNFLLFAGTGVDELLMLKRMLDGIACTLATAQDDPIALEQALTQLKQFKLDENLGGLQPSLGIYRQILRLTNNRIVQVFGETLSQLAFGVGICLGSPDFMREGVTESSRRWWAHRLYQLERVLAGDLNGALQVTGTIHDGILNTYAESPYQGKRFFLGNSFAHTHALAERIVEAFPLESNGRRQETLGLQIQLDILRLGYQPGSPVGSEKTLMEIYAVGRNVLRESIRALERDHIVTSTEGRNGGLCVAEPSSANVVRTCSLFLKFMQVTNDEIEPVAREVLAVCAEIVAKAAGCNGGYLPPSLLNFFKEEGEDCNQCETTFPVRILRAMTEATGNPILKLFGQTLAELHLKNAPPTGPTDLRLSLEQASTLKMLEQSLLRGDEIMSERLIRLQTLAPAR